MRYQQGSCLGLSMSLNLSFAISSRYNENFASCIYFTTFGDFPLSMVTPYLSHGNTLSKPCVGQSSCLKVHLPVLKVKNLIIQILLKSAGILICGVYTMQLALD